MSKAVKIGIVVVLVIVVGVVLALKRGGKPSAANAGRKSGTFSAAAVQAEAGLPRFMDLGAGKCIPCKMMAPILADLKKTYAGRLQVDLIDVNDDPETADKLKVSIIPTQIFFDAAGKELFRHEGFMSKEDILAKWKELGLDLSAAGPTEVPRSESREDIPAKWKGPGLDLSAAGPTEGPRFERLQPAKADDRPRDKVCFLCYGDIDPKTQVAVVTAKGHVRLCSPHCYFILYSCLTEDKTGFHEKTCVTDWSTGEPIIAPQAIYLYGLDEKTGRPTIKAFAARAAALKEQAASGGNVVPWAILERKELATRCGFCDRAVYPEDAAVVRMEGLYTWGCCCHCSMGVAARTGKDIEVHERDRFTGEEVVVKTLAGKVASIEPSGAVAWLGQRPRPDGTWASAGCLHQGFFVNAENLKKWVEAHPHETGRLISIHQALADKMKMNPQQIQKACRIGECAPK